MSQLLNYRLALLQWIHLNHHLAQLILPQQFELVFSFLQLALMVVEVH